MRRALLAAIVLASAGCAGDAPASLVPPTAEEAGQAVARMFGQGVADRMGVQGVQLGTCIRTPARYEPAPGQYTCTFAVLSPGGSSESRADFIPTRRGWRAEPSLTEDGLPFPDPALQSP